MVKRIIDESIANMPTVGERIRAGHFDILANGEVVLPHAWESTVRPGISLKLKAWRSVPTFPGDPPITGRPMPGGLPPGFGPPRFGPPPGIPFSGSAPAPPPNWNPAVPPRPMGMMPPPRWIGPPPPPPRWFSSPSSSTTASDWDAPDVVDRDMENAGLKIDFAEELEKIEPGLGALLEKWTNSPDTEGDTYDDDSFYLSDTSSESSAEIVD